MRVSYNTWLAFLYRHMAKGIQQITPFTLPEESTEIQHWSDTVFSYRSLCNGYWITYSSRIRDHLLLFHLVLTCKISTLTFTTRYQTIYNCGWWYRGSTHLQMWQQGLTAYKTSWKSWPAYRVYTYMDRELMLAAGTVISSSSTRIIGKYFQNPGNTEMYIISAVRLRITPHASPYE